MLVLFIFLPIWAIIIAFTIRNQKVFQRRIELLNMASKKAKKLIDLGIDDCMQPYRELERVSYEEMVFKFWKPIRSFHNEEALKS